MFEVLEYLPMSQIYIISTILVQDDGLNNLDFADLYTNSSISSQVYVLIYSLNCRCMFVFSHNTYSIGPGIICLSCLVLVFNFLYTFVIIN